MYKFICIAVTFVLSLFLLSDVTAGSNGDAPQEGQDWIITQDTHVWDSDINVKDIVVTFGKTLKLENVSLSSLGLMDINGDTSWINSTIYHEQSTSGENISLHSKLTIVNSDFILRTIQDNEKETANCLYLSPGSSLIIRDYDMNADTISDRSIIKSDVSGKGNYTEKFNYTTDIHGSIDAKVEIVNSEFEYINLLKFNSDGSYIRNSTFNLFGSVVTNSEGFIFENNTMTDSYKWWNLDIIGNDTFLYNNTFFNGSGGIAIQSHRNHIEANNFLNFSSVGGFGGGSSERGKATLFLNHGSSNNTIINNHFENLVNINALTSHTSSNNVITQNYFSNAGHDWHTVNDLSGYRNNYNNNSFHSCTGESRDENWLYAACISFYSYSSVFTSFPDARYGGEHIVENNTFENYNIGVSVLSYQNNNTLRNNKLNDGVHGLGLWNWIGGSTAPSGNLILNNTINNTRYPLVLDYFHAGYPGTNNSIISNSIINTEGGAITVWSTFKDFTIRDNYIENASQGIWIYDDLFGEITNGFIVNNIVKNVTGNAISAYTGSTISMENIHVVNNYFHSTNGAGIFLRDVKKGYIANNTILTNLSRESQLTGILGYYIPETVIVNNTVTSAVGIEVGGFVSSALPITIDGNELNVNDYGIISNRTYTKIINNNVTGFCVHEKCNILYLQKVAAIGIFSQEGEVEIENNYIFNFREAVTIVLADFELSYNTINFSETAITTNNSQGEIKSNDVTNNTVTLSSYISNIDIVNNIFSDFEKAIYAINSTLLIEDNFFSEGDFCIDLIDSDYNLVTNDFSCREMDYQVRYNIRISVADEFGVGSEDHPFDIYNSGNNLIIDSLTKKDGLSDYFQVDIIRKEAGESLMTFNPLKISYENNNIPVIIYKNISYNHTINVLLDTTSPVTIISSGDSLIRQETIVLDIILIDDNGDLEDYIIEYLVNEEFAEWEVYGTFTTSPVLFEGTDGKDYRFRSLGRDIYGNTESKDIFEYQVKVDTTTPETYFNNFAEDYYFTGSQFLELNWNSDDIDVSNQLLEVYFTNFSEPYLNPNSVTWFLVDSFDISDQQSYSYDFEQVGHYAFKILSEDLAGNLESKDTYDVIFNYDSDSDTLNFGNIPNRWGEDQLTIDYLTSSFNLDFDLFISLEDVSDNTEYLTWYKYEYTEESNQITLTGLQDDTRYYFYAVSRDLAGNVEDPLNSTEYYSSNGLYNQQMEIKYIPLLDWGYDFIVEVDDNLDGIYETTLIRGEDQNRLKSNEYYLDLESKTIIFGGLSNGGYVPSEDLNLMNNVRVLYSGVQGIFEVYTGEPESASSLNIIPSNTTELIVSFVVPKDSQSCKVQRTTNISKGYFNEMIITPCKSGLIEYIHTNPDISEIYFYRILIEDEFGHESISENRSIDMKDVVKLYSSTSDSDSSLLGMDSIIPITALVGVIMLGFGGVLLYRSRSDDILDENVSVIESKPVAKYKVEELYLIYKDGRLVKNLSDVEVKTDSDIMSGMLTAINDFVQDSFNTEGDLGSIDYGNNKIILQRGNNSYLAAVIYGEVDKFFKGKMINAVRNIENANPSMGVWNGDAETIVHTEHYLQPIIDETKQSTKEMVDNYFSEKEIVLTTSYEKIGNVVELQVHMSNYSAGGIKNCRLVPEYNSSNLSLTGIEPDVFYSFTDNTFIVGDLESYNEVTFQLKFQMKVAGTSPLEIKMNYEQKGRKGVANSLLEII